MASLSIPTTSTLDHAQRVSSNDPAVSKILNRLSRPSLLSLALDWLDDRNQDITAPYLALEDEEIDPQDLHPPVQSLEELREIYTEMQQKKGGKRDVLDRIIEGDWRDGISLYQIAMAEMQYLYDHPTSQKWTALKVVQLASEGADDDAPPSPPLSEEPTVVPRFHPATFLQNLQSESLPDVKAHYSLDRHPTLPLLLLRVFILDSPYNTSLSLQSATVSQRPNQITTFDSSRTFYIAFPDASPFIYVSLTTSSTTNINSTTSTTPSKNLDTRSLRKLTLDSIPKAFSRPRQRYGLESTNLSARNLEALVERRGGGRSNAAGGGWGIYAEENRKDTPLNLIPDAQLPTPEASTGEEDDEESAGAQKTMTLRGLKRKNEDNESIIKRRKKIAESRFGNAARATDGKGIERFEVRIDDPYPNDGVSVNDGGESDLKPNVRITFNGTHVFAGIRELVEAGVIDGVRMPGWMTGEEGVSIGVVENGRIKGFKGSGV
ncbi:centromere protein Chl4/mis15/CENP-N [Xylogone sp. PMI_703]|nr:centromere protein Chl4/mis15/CENP-N [Xylogone sp. PMI_703]